MTITLMTSRLRTLTNLEYTIVLQWDKHEGYQTCIKQLKKIQQLTAEDADDSFDYDTILNIGHLDRQSAINKHFGTMRRCMKE
jgi:hypothetical protein